MKKFFIAAFIFLILGMIWFFNLDDKNEEEVKQGTITHFEKMVDEKLVKGVVIDRTSATVYYRVGNDVYKTGVVSSYVDFNEGVFKKLKEQGVIVETRDGTRWIEIVSLLSSMFMDLSFLLFFIILLFGLPKSDLEYIEEETTRLDDLGGLDNVKKEVKLIIEYIKKSKEVKDRLYHIPKGILFEGSPGNGKTMLAKAIAGEAGVPFFYIGASDIEGMFVGQGALRIKRIFSKVKKVAERKGYAILFIDELDAVGINRSKRRVVETNQTVNALLTQLDGFDKNTNILVIGATNLVDMLDPALVRSGRFDRVIKIPSPSYKDRKSILEKYLWKKKDFIDGNVWRLGYVDVLARQTEGMSGADLSRIVNDALMLSYEENKKVGIKHLRESYLRVRMGLPRDLAISEEDLKVIAYHEAAHAIVSMAVSPNGVYSVAYGTIKAYGDSLGHIAFVDNDKVLYKKTDYGNKVKILLAGRAVEDKILNGNFTSGAMDDLRKVNELLYSYVVKSGMSPKNMNVYIDPEWGDWKAQWIQDEVKALRDELYKETRELVEMHFRNIEKLANYLLKHKEVDQDELIKMFEEYYPRRAEEGIIDVGSSTI